jgi:transcriptional regulator with XRE-family HTH domain
LPCANLAKVAKRIPVGFYETPKLRAALSDCDFGPVFSAVRKQAHLSQTELGSLVDLTQSRVSAVERGERGIGHIKLVARVATRLGIPAHLLGFAADSDGNLTGKEVSWVDRRDFITLVTAATLGSNLHPELARLGSVLPGRLAPVTRPRIGEADVEAIESITDGFRRWDLAHGGGLCRSAALAQLHQVRTLKDAVCSPEVRTRLLVATAELSSMAGWLTYDVEDHDAARRLWTFALDMARRGEDHPRSTDLTISILLDMAHQALHLHRPGEALQFTRLAEASASNRRYPASLTAQAYISAVLGWCRASLGEAEPTRRAIGESQERYGQAESSPTPPWANFHGSGWPTNAEITAQQGYSLYLLALSDRRFAPEAVEKLTVAVSGYSAAHERSRAVNLPPLASAQFLAGDTTAALDTSRQAITAISGLSSVRCYARLRNVDTVAADFADQADVAQLRADLETALAVTA